MSSVARSKIRCPNCGKDGNVRAELLNHRVSCKQCRHVFRAVAVGDPAVARTTPTRVKPAAKSGPTRSPSGHRIVALEREIRQLRDDLSSGLALVGQVEWLRDALARSTAELEGAKKSLEALRLERGEAVAHRDRRHRGAGRPHLKPEITAIPDGWSQRGPAVEADALDDPTRLDDPAGVPEFGDEASDDPDRFESRFRLFRGTTCPADEIPEAEARRSG